MKKVTSVIGIGRKYSYFPRITLNKNSVVYFIIDMVSEPNL